MATRYGSAEVTLPSDREILITRTFDAAAPLVWEAMTQPRHLLRWWGPDWCPLVECEVDLRVGGTWRYVSRDVEGNELGWHGTYREIDPPHRIVSTEVFEGFPDAESVNTMTLVEQAGATTLRTLVSTRPGSSPETATSPRGWKPGCRTRSTGSTTCSPRRDAPSERFRRVAGRFSDRAREVPATAWDNPSPCEGWTARDVVRHLVEWMPDFLIRAGVTIPPGPTVDADPAAAWAHLAESIQGLLDDPEIAHEFDAGPPGRMTYERGGMLMVGDIVIHTWDLATRPSSTNRLDEAIAREMLDGDAAPRRDDPPERTLRTEGGRTRRRRRSDQAHRLHRPHAVKS